MWRKWFNHTQVITLLGPEGPGTPIRRLLPPRGALTAAPADALLLSSPGGPTMKINREKFAAIALSMSLSQTVGCVIQTQPQPQTPAAQAAQSQEPAAAPADECTSWDPSGECIGWAGDSAAPVNESGYQPTAEGTPPAPADECVNWDPSGECIGWAGDSQMAPANECVNWDPSGECIGWQ